MIQVNLIPDVKRDLLRAQLIRNWVIFGSMLVGGISAAAIIIALSITGAQNVIRNLNDSSIKANFNNLTKISDINETIIVQSQLSEISNIRNNAPNTSRILGAITSAVQTKGSNEVKFTAIQYDPETNTVTFEGQTAGGYPALDAFKKTILGSKILYRDELKGTSCSVKDAENEENGCHIIGLTEDEDVFTEGVQGQDTDGNQTLRFTVRFVLNQVALKFETKDFAVKSPSKADVTDSTTVIPDGIFTVDSSKEEVKNGQ